jgi:hypothetical protein
MVIPERRGLIEVAALAAAVIIALQLAASYWLYSYIVWFYAPLIVALFGSFPSEVEHAVAVAVDARASESASLAVAGTP